ncbi:MAG: hypothetical protein ACK54K_04095, partial [Gemmatimonadaceae bacterium]
MRSSVTRHTSASTVLAAFLASASAAPLAAQPAPAAANGFTSVSRWTPPPPPAGKKPITQETYDLWRTISGAALSNDGRWAAYTLSPVVGE